MDNGVRDAFLHRVTSNPPYLVWMDAHLFKLPIDFFSAY